MQNGACGLMYVIFLFIVMSRESIYVKRCSVICVDVHECLV